VAAGPRELLASSLGGLARTLERAATASTYVAAVLLRFEAHYEHRFRPEEIEAEARDAGLAVTWHEHDGDGNLALRVARADGP
jgi:hypothetical protein